MPASNPDIRIRDARPGDLDLLLHLALISDLLSEDELPELAPAFDAHLRAAPRQQSAWFIAENPSGNACGTAYFALEPFTDRTWQLLLLAVPREHHRKGIARTLFAAGCAWLHRRNARMLFLNTSSHDDHIPARSFYTSLGMTQVGFVPDFYIAGVARFTYALTLD